MNTISLHDKINVWYAIASYRLFPPVIKREDELIWFPETLISMKDRMLTAIVGLVLYISGIVVLFNFSKIISLSTPLILLYFCIMASGWAIVASVLLIFLIACRIYDYHPIQKYKVFHFKCGQGW